MKRIPKPLPLPPQGPVQARECASGAGGGSRRASRARAAGRIDLAMKLAQTYVILTTIQSITGSDRDRPSLWLRRRALLGRSIYERD
jgi:hypothetical protein